MRLKDQIEKAGIENCVFLVPMRKVNVAFGLFAYTSSDDPLQRVPAKISESRYKIEDNYKITLVAIYPEYGKEHYYISDLQSMIDDGTIDFFVKAPSF